MAGLDRLAAPITRLDGSVAIKIPAWSAIVYRSLYRGVDLYYRISESRLKSEFVVAANADPQVIRMRYLGARSVRVAADGALVIDTAIGTIRDSAPEIYQENGSARTPVRGEYRLWEDGSVSFRLGSYDRRRPLVIDPTLSFSSYFGGGGQDAATAIATDGAGNMYVAGWSISTGALLPGASQFQSGGGVDAFVAKITAAGTLVYCTYVGGSGDDRAFGIAVDGSGSAYITGWTYSTNFPLAGSPLQNHLAGVRDAFVAKLNATGNGLIYSTFLGGAGNDAGRGIRLDAAGNAYVGGETDSANFPVYAAFQPTIGGQQDGFVAKVNSVGSKLIYSTYFGGVSTDSITAIALDSSGSVYVTGGTTSYNFPVFHAFQPAIGGGQDAFVAKLDPSGSALIYSTFLGGSGGTVGFPEYGSGVDVDGGGNVYVVGATSSVNFPVLGAFQPILGGFTDVFAAKLNAAGSALIYSTYLGGSSVDIATAAAVVNGQLYVAGYTVSSDFPVLNPVQPASGGDYDSFVVCLNAGGSSLLFGTLLGGTGSDSANGLAVDSSGNIFLAGQTQSFNFPLSQPLQSTNASGSGAFISRVANPSLRVAGDLDGNGHPDLLWQNLSDGSVTVWYLGGATGTQVLSTGVLAGLTNPWSLRGLADLDGNGIPDLLTFKADTAQAAVWFLGGAEGNQVEGTSWLNTSPMTGWEPVGLADFDGNGTPDVIWQNDTTRQIAVWYLGGAKGSAFLGFNWLCGASMWPWSAVGFVDLNHDGKVDLVWQNDETGQIAVWYLGGAMGNAFQSFAWIDPVGQPGWKVVGAVDLNSDGNIDLVFQSASSSQLLVWYMGGALGNQIISTGSINGMIGAQAVMSH
jgi:FG-GAP-like repeat/Beta-propeller repeat